MALYGFTMVEDSTGDTFATDRIQDAGTGSPPTYTIWPGVKIGLGILDEFDGFVATNQPMPSVIRDASGNALNIIQMSDTLSGSEYGLAMYGLYPTGSGEWLPIYMDDAGRVRVIVDEDGNDITGTSLVRSTNWGSDKYGVLTSAAGWVNGFSAYNPGDAITWLHFFDAATTAAVTLGSTTPKLSFVIPPNGYLSEMFPKKVNFGNGVIIGQTTTETGVTGPSDDLEGVNVFVSAQ